MGAPRARRAAALLCAVAVVASLGSPATAAKKKPAAKPVETKLFFHGTLPSGEVEVESNPGVYLRMTPAEASGSEPKSYQLTNYFAGPNTECAGNALFPVWVGSTAGKIVGDLKVTLHTIATGGSVEVGYGPT